MHVPRDQPQKSPSGDSNISRSYASIHLAKLGFRQDKPYSPGGGVWDPTMCGAILLDETKLL